MTGSVGRAPLDLAAVEPVEGVPSAEFLEQHGLLPLGLADGSLTVATWLDAPDPRALDDLRAAVGAPVTLVRRSRDDVRDAIRRVYGEEARTASSLIQGLDDSDADADLPIDLDHVPLDDLVSLANEPPVVRLVNLFLLEALEARASDVHLEQYESRLRVRYRVDGVLQDVSAPPARMAPAIVSRLKIMARLDVAERRVPQDGRVRLRLRDRDVDVRVSTLPTLNGESVVLRLLDKERGRIALDQLGMAPDTLAGFQSAIRSPNGIVLVTGPTGSGKTTTLYAAIDRIRTGAEKIVTVEDPVEYELEGVPQVAVNAKVGLTFARALRALLRQDPDVLLVGEIRDEETAEIAVHAALTGHLVLSTLHTNDAVGAVTRLADLGVPPYLLAGTLRAVLAQRLLRRLCRNCGGAGCDECLGSGYRGRTGAYELLVVDDAVRAAIHSAADPEAVRAAATAAGLRSLADDAARLVRDGVTRDEERLRVTAP